MEKTTAKVTGGTENLFEANDDVKCILTIRKLFMNYYNNRILFIKIVIFIFKLQGDQDFLHFWIIKRPWSR